MPRVLNSNHLGSLRDPGRELFNVLSVHRQFGRWKRKNARQAQPRGGKQELWHCLIDYKADNRVLLKRALSRDTANARNKLLEGSGRAWALCNP